MILGVVFLEEKGEVTQYRLHHAVWGSSHQQYTGVDTTQRSNPQ